MLVIRRCLLGHARDLAPLHPCPPSPADVAHAPEVCLQEATDPLPPTPHPPQALHATLAPPTCVQPHRTVCEHFPTMLEPLDDEPLF